MSFDTEVVKPGRGRCFRVDISLDDFATVAYRYSDVAGALDGTNEYEPRVREVGSIRRAFGQNRLATSSSTSLKLANADGGVDWICGRENIADAKRARFRIYVVLYAPGASSLVFTEKMLGEYVLSRWPTQDNEVVMLALGDDFVGRLGVGLQLPTLLDWQAVGTTSNNPIKNAIGIPQRISQNTPVGLAFGEDPILAFPHILPWDNQGVGSPYRETIIVPLYSTMDLSAVSQDLVQQVVVERFRVPSGLDTPEDPVPVLQQLPRTVWDEIRQLTHTIWTVEKSPTITKAGRDFQIVYLKVISDLEYAAVIAVQDPENPEGYEQAVQQRSALAYSGGYPTDAVTQAGTKYAQYGSRVTKWYARCYPGSQITNPPASFGFGIAHSIDVLIDLISTYSDAVVSPADWPRIKAGSPFASCAGVVAPWTERANNPSVPPPPMSLRQVLTEIAQSADLDVFAKWSGEISFSSDVYDFTTATQFGSLVEIDETSVNNMMRWTPSDGERGAPFNTVYFTGGKASPTTRQDVPFQGPFEVSGADIPRDAGLVEMELRQGWRPYRQQALDPVSWRGLDGTCRDRIKFSTNLSGLRLELGSFFKLNWTRSPQLGATYAATVFQCEAIGYSPDGDVVELEGVWRDDTVTERQYLLDDEDLYLHPDLIISNTATTDGAENVAFGATVDLTNLELPGALLVLEDSTQAEDVFTRCGAWQILTVDLTAGANAVTIAPNGEGDYPAAGTVASGDWKILFGATQKTSVIANNPASYTSGADVYGAVTDADGDYSDTTTGNRLVSG